MTTDWTKTASLLKAVVIGLAALILLGVAVMVSQLISRAGDVVVASPVPVEAPDAYASATVKLPSGSRVVAMTVEGDHLTLLVEDAEARQRVITIDARSGAVLGILTLEPE